MQDSETLEDSRTLVPKWQLQRSQTCMCHLRAIIPQKSYSWTRNFGWCHQYSKKQSSRILNVGAISRILKFNKLAKLIIRGLSKRTLKIDLTSLRHNMFIEEYWKNPNRASLIGNAVFREDEEF